MEFKFNFRKPEGEINEWLSSGNDEVNNHAERLQKEENIRKFVEVIPNNSLKIEGDKYKINNLRVGDCFLSYISSEDIQSDTLDTIQLANKDHSDLIPGIYEGGLKIWECTLDLINYLQENDIVKKGMNILDLGCGAGLAGIFAYLKGANVDFQDYNEEVLRHLTIKNVLLNVNEQMTEVPKLCRFFAGDWKSIHDHFNKIFLECPKYDIILTSETIYNPANQQDLLQLMKTTLKSNGRIYLAAKTYYFGVGGGLRQFEEEVGKEGVFTAEVCQVFNIGVQREIILLQFR
ncbi:histidine protein methyltransferase 1 homolog [Centruroides vittatus]|uniref:histidine protein methyltransferase 1 homolog n=1 Tax=Centruroides vittatus TaxID=120091 RepID=UPI00350E9EA0